MTNSIRTYDDLLKEEQRLEALVKVQKDQLKQGLHSIKEELRPARQAIGFVGKLFVRDKSNPVVANGANLLVDILLKKVVLRRAGWLVKMIIPYFAKNISSHVVADKKEDIVNRISSWIWPKKTKTNGAGGHEDIGTVARPKTNPDL